MTDRWLVLQLADSAFPSGGFAHSGGLEASAQLGETRTAEEVRAFISAAVWQAGYGALPFVFAAHEEPARIGELDAFCHAFLSSQVANRASRAQGRAFVSATARIFDDAPIAAIEARVGSRELHGHHPPLFGAITAALRVDRETSGELFLHLVLRGVGSAAVRLGIAGAHEAQRIQRDSAPLLDRVKAECGALRLGELAQTAPLIDLVGSAHDRLFSRLFQS